MNALPRALQRKNFFLCVAAVIVVAVLVLQGLLGTHALDIQRRILRQSEANGVLLNERDAASKATITKLQAQITSSGRVLIELYTALNASQRQVTDLGGVPLHFEFTIPTTTISPTQQGSPP